MIVTSHPPGYLPAVSTLAKIAQADAVVWLDRVRFTTPGYFNRNQLPTGEWLVVPVQRRSHRDLLCEVALAPGSWPMVHAAALRDRYAAAEHFDTALVQLIESGATLAGTQLAAFNIAIAEHMMRQLGLGARTARQSLYPDAGGSVETKLARLVSGMGGTTYLAAANRRINPDPFEAAGIELSYFDYAGANPSAVDPLMREGQLPEGPRQLVRDRGAA